jgi:hypothetical protein
VYLTLLGVALTNLIWMRRPRDRAAPQFEVMIPARNEAHNLADLLPPLVGQGVRVTVFDDESTDGTGELAAKLGAHVITASDPLLPGWTGKNRACHQLSLRATSEWTVFLDADTKPTEEFASVLAGSLQTTPSNVNCVTGFPRMLPGRGPEPLYLGWVPWILLATNPFGLVQRTGRGHNRFTNGQFAAWRTTYLHELKPYETLRDEVLEDVKIGRLLAKLGQPVSVLQLAPSLSVRMYDTLQQAFHGMSKNSGQIAGSAFGSLLLAGLFVFIGVGWMLGGSLSLPLYGVLVASKLVTDRIVRYPVYTAPFIPITCLSAAATILRSVWLKRSGRIEWKGRTYQ